MPSDGDNQPDGTNAAPVNLEGPLECETSDPHREVEVLSTPTEEEIDALAVTLGRAISLRTQTRATLEEAETADDVASEAVARAEQELRQAIRRRATGKAVEHLEAEGEVDEQARHGKL